MWIGFLGAEVNNNSCIRYCAILGDKGNNSVRHDKNGIGAFLSRLVTSLCHAAEIFAEGPLPNIFGCWVVHEFLIAAYRLSSYGMYHGHRNLVEI